MDDIRIGNALRAIRIRKNLRQADVARRARVSRQVVSRIENGAVGRYPLDTVRAVAGASGMRLDIRPRWRGADLDRVLNSAHAAMHEAVLRHLAGMRGWEARAEVSYSIYGERGVIDILAWHPASRCLLVIELKTELVDPQGLVASMHRRQRLAPAIALEFGWHPSAVGAWVIVRRSSTQKRRLHLHAGLLRGAFPEDGRAMRRWLRSPGGTVSALSFVSDGAWGGVRDTSRPVRRVRHAVAHP
jgi:transcriptional regulator with XRE-family HTH domain